MSSGKQKTGNQLNLAYYKLIVLLAVCCRCPKQAHTILFPLSYKRLQNSYRMNQGEVGIELT